MGEKKKPPSRVSFVQLQISRPDPFQPARSRLTHDYFIHHGLCYHTQMGCFLYLVAAGSREIFLRRGSKCRDGHSGEGAYKFFLSSSHLSKGEVASANLARASLGHPNPTCRYLDLSDWQKGARQKASCHGCYCIRKEKGCHGVLQVDGCSRLQGCHATHSHCLPIWGEGCKS